MLAVFLFSASVFFLTSSLVQAQTTASAPTSSASDVAAAAMKAIGSGIGGLFTMAINSILYAIFQIIGLFLSASVTLFEFAINPANISGQSGLLNKASVYENWKVIRDFFNLFFILTLLYTAFTIVFQVAKDYKKTLLSLVLAALFINFSFPVTRVIIDVSNVPMYYFANQMMAKEGGKSYFGNFLGASKIQATLIPEGYSPTESSTKKLLMAIVVLFLFTMTLLVLSVMMVVRLVALLVLLIFSSVGFAAAVIPGLQSYSKMWWDNLAKYALFGPASMLMLLVATRFFAEIGNDMSGQQYLAAATKNAVPEAAPIIASLAQFAVPVIMMWFAIGLSSYMSIHGAGAVVGQAQKFSKWMGKKTYNNSLTRGVGSGAKSRFEGKYPALNRFLTSSGGTEAAIKGWAKKTGVNVFGKAGRAGARTELQKLKDKQIHEQIGKDKENKLSRTDALNRLSSTDDVMRISAATSLANMDNGIQSMDDLTKALDALKQIDPATGRRTIVDPSYTEKALEIVNKVDKKVIASTTEGGVVTYGLQNLHKVIGSLGKNEKAISDLIAKLDDSAFSGSGAHYGEAYAALESVKPGMGAALEAKAKKEGQAAVLVDYEIGKAQANGPITPEQEEAIVAGVLNKMKASEVADQVSLFTDSPHSETAIFSVQALPNQGEGGKQRYLEIKKQAKGNVAAVL